MKTQSAALAAHRLGTTTLAYCWLVTRLDGTVFAFTSHDADIVYDGITYQAAPGFTPSAIAGSGDLAVGNLDVVGPVSVATISDADVKAGRWDYAEVLVFEVNYMDLTMGRCILSSGTLGNLSTGKVQFQAEQRDIAQKLQQPVGRVIAAACDADLGDARCGINLEALRVAGTVTAAASQSAFTASALTQAADYFGAGEVTWITGLNAGMKMEIQTFSAGAFALALKMPYSISIGDTFTVVPGCRKREQADCKTKYNNIVNFRGFAHLPGNNVVLGSAGLASA